MRSLVSSGISSHPPAGPKGRRHQRPGSSSPLKVSSPFSSLAPLLRCLKSGISESSVSSNVLGGQEPLSGQPWYRCRQAMPEIRHRARCPRRGTYVNFLTEEEGDDRTRAAYRTNYPRLARLKAEWDPGNLFHTNKNIVRA